MPNLDIIVPVHNEQESIRSFVSEIEKTQKSLSQEVNLRIFFIDDGSSDKSWEIIAEVSADKSIGIDILGLRLSRNYGKESALYAGIVNSSADAMIPMDVDLQDPPSLIPEFVEAWSKGARMIVASRAERVGESIFKKKSAEYFYKIYNSISDLPIPENVGDYRLIDKSVADDITRITESNKFMKGIFSYVAVPDAEIQFIRGSGLRSDTNKPAQNLSKLLDLAEIALTSAGPKLFRKILSFLIFFDVLLILYAFFVIVIKFLSSSPFEGFTSIILLIVLTSSVQLTFLAVFGVIVSRVYLESKNRPSYFVRDKINLQ